MQSGPCHAILYLDTGDDGFRQDAFQNLHGLRVLCQHSLDNGLHPGGVTLHPQVCFDARQQLCPLDWLAAWQTSNLHACLYQASWQDVAGYSK